MKTPRERYMSDPAFAALVNTIIATIKQGDFTPTEIREAALLAHIIYEERNCSLKPLPFEISKWLDGK